MRFENIVFILGIVQIPGLIAKEYLACDANEHLMDPPQCLPLEDIPTYFPYPNDCTKYFECTNGDARCIQCAQGTRWDQALQTCNHDNLVECSFATPASSQETSSSTLSTELNSEETAFSGRSHENQAEWVCEEGYEGAIGHPFDCSQFYICDPGRRPCLFACSSGLYWNPVTKDCDWPWNVPSCKGNTPRPLKTPTLTNYRNFPRFDVTDFEVIVVRRRTEGEEPCQFKV